MFSNNLKYYHGTSESRWALIKSESELKPSHLKKIGDYWITKGVYFVCENPFIALWYAHVASLNDHSNPLVICIQYEIDDTRKSEIVNLLTSDGHKLLALAHNLYKNKLNLDLIKSTVTEHENMDSYALELLMSKSKKIKGIIACFQEGNSFQSMIIEHKYTNKYIPLQKGFSPGDHVEICFFPNLKIGGLELKILSKKEILTEVEPGCNIWELVCQGLTEPLENSKFKIELSDFLNS